ncbi:MAG TPA: pyridoxamine 5'-phosphate oxidase family protein [Lautropia sp.]|nr:pyridoxamine 5'-phosphate oxidase family protein [Lautropia sp.]
MVNDVLRPVDDTARTLAKRLLRTASRASLATLEPQTGWPYGSLVTVATTLDGRPLLLVSTLSLHTRALAADPRCSLLLDEPGTGDPLAKPRLTIFGRAEFLDRESEPGVQARQRFLSRHPKASLYADFGDFSFVRIDPDRALLNAGFGRASELAAGDFVAPPDAGDEVASRAAGDFI